MVPLLLERGVIVDDENGDGGTPLFAAVYAHKAMAVKALLLAGANREHRNKSGQTISDICELGITCRQGDRELIAIEAAAVRALLAAPPQSLP